MNQNPDPDIEQHPLPPFLPSGATLLMLGSFPPQQKRWCMDFYYPNFINDMWRVMGLLYYNDRNHFVDKAQKRFKKTDIVVFLEQKGIALYDTATAVRRLQDNASDKYLEVVAPTDIPVLLEKLPACKAVVTTGQKATETLCDTFRIPLPPIGTYRLFRTADRELRLYRMPSTSRAYPMKLEKKAEFYRIMLAGLDLL